MVISNFSWRGSLYVPVLMGFSRKQSLKLSLCGSTPVRVQSRGSKNEWYKKKESKYEMCVTKLATASEKASLVRWSCRRSHGKSQKHCTDQPIRGRRAAYLLVPSHLLPFTAHSSPHGELCSHTTELCYPALWKVRHRRWVKWSGIPIS